MINKNLIFIALLLPGLAFADETFEQCTLLSGTLIQLPKHPVFKFVKAAKYSRNNYPMTHIQFFIKANNEQAYKVVVDNLFYTNLTNSQAQINRDVGITADFKHRYPLGSNVEVCGKVYNKGHNPGIHFVHPSACITTKFNGFLRINGADITHNLQYCGNCGCSAKSNKWARD